MINTQLKFEGKIHYGSKVVAFVRNYTKFLSFKSNLTHPSHLDARLTSQLEGKIQNGSIFNVKINIL